MSTIYSNNDHTPVGMSTSLRRTGSVTRSRSIMTPSIGVKRSSAFLNTSSTALEFGNLLPGREGDLMNEAAGLRKIIEGLNKTNAALRTRISDLETHIDHNTGPEVETLSKELSTLEDLFARSQKDNEAHYAESERHKVYVKELEGLLTTSLGADWQESHNVYPPPPTTTIVTASTPLPPPKPTNPLRHSVSFSGKRSTSKLHKRASSVMDLGLMSLQAVKEDDASTGLDDTPTGALRKLSGSISSKKNEEEESKIDKDDEKAKRKGNGDNCFLTHERTPENMLETLSSSTRSIKNLTSLTSIKPQETKPILCGVDVNQLNHVLQLLSTMNIETVNTSIAKQSPDLSSSQERKKHIGMMRKMLENQQKILSDRETRLNSLIQMAKDKENKYSMTIRTNSGHIAGS